MLQKMSKNTRKKLDFNEESNLNLETNKKTPEKKEFSLTEVLIKFVKKQKKNNLKEIYRSHNLLFDKHENEDPNDCSTTEEIANIIYEEKKSPMKKAPLIKNFSNSSCDSTEDILTMKDQNSKDLVTGKERESIEKSRREYLEKSVKNKVDFSSIEKTNIGDKENFVNIIKVLKEIDEEKKSPMKKAPLIENFSNSSCDSTEDILTMKHQNGEDLVTGKERELIEKSRREYLEKSVKNKVDFSSIEKTNIGDKENFVINKIKVPNELEPTPESNRRD